MSFLEDDALDTGEELHGNGLPHLTNKTRQCHINTSNQFTNGALVNPPVAHLHFLFLIPHLQFTAMRLLDC